VPTSDPARIFTAFYVLFGLAFVLTAAVEVAKFIISKVQNKMLFRLHSSDNIVLKEMNKIGLTVIFVSIAVLMGTCFFAVNEQWTAAQAFYWTIVTMTVSCRHPSFFTFHHLLPPKMRAISSGRTADCYC
jgi:hypothetical protein